MNIICQELDGVEFFTVESTGESGMSQSGLALLCGVSGSTVLRYEKSLLRDGHSEEAKLLLEQASTLLRQGSYSVNGKVTPNLKIYKSTFCAVVIQHYAMKGNKTAIFSLTKFASIGINTWIQSITGWQNPTTRSGPQPQTPSPTAQPKSLPPAPGWNPEVWNELPEEDKQHFSESKKQVDARLKRERADIDRFLDRCWYRRV